MVKFLFHIPCERGGRLSQHLCCAYDLGLFPIKRNIQIVQEDLRVSESGRVLNIITVACSEFENGKIDPRTNTCIFTNLCQRPNYLLSLTKVLSSDLPGSTDQTTDYYKKTFSFCSGPKGMLFFFFFLNGLFYRLILIQ